MPAPRLSFERVAAAVVVAGATAFGLASVVRFPHWLVDDAYISLRYARNLVEHGQLNWNVGHDPVEGYTGVALPLIVAALRLVGVGYEAAAHAIGLVSCFAAAGLLLAVLARMGVRPLVRAGAVVLYFAAGQLPIHAWSGLETLLFTASILAVVYGFLVWSDGPSTARRDLLIAGPGLFVSLVRPEGLALGAGFAALGLVLLAARRQRVGPYILRMAVYLGAPLGVYFAARILYYGHPLPNTFYAKTVKAAGFTPTSVANFKVWVRLFLVVPVVGVGAVVAVGLACALAGRRLQRPRTLSAPALAVAGVVGFAAAATLLYLRSDLIMMYANRFFMPFWPAVLIAAAVLVDRSLRLAAGTGPVAVALVALIASGTTAAEAAKAHQEAASARLYAAGYRTLLRDEHIPIGHYLERNLPKGSWVVVLLDAGSIPFHAHDLNFVDAGRLNDEFLAHNPVEIHSPQAIDYYLSHDPAAFVATLSGDIGLKRAEPGTPLPDDPRLRRYRLVAVLTTTGLGGEGYRQHVYVRDDIAVPPWPGRPGRLAAAAYGPP